MLYLYNSLLKNLLVKTEENKYTLEVELPRFKKEDVTIEVSDGILSLKADNKTDRYTYSAKLNDSIDIDGITSTLEYGVLQIVLPKKKQKKKNTKKIEIR